MGRHRFEKEFAEKLRDRKLEPSAEGWSKLQARLETSEEKKSGFPLKWVSIAASVAAAVLVWNLAFQSGDFEQAPEVVNSASEEILKNDNSIEEIEIASEEAEQPIKKETNAHREASEVNQQQTKQRRETITLAMSGKEQEVQQTVEIKKQSVIASLRKSELAGNMNGMTAETSSGVGIENSATDAEIEALLQKAAASIHMENRSVADIDINAGSLLYEVEMEIEKSFRDKVFEVLKDSYLKTRTAVANRNF